MTTPKRPRRAMTSAEHDEWLKETGQYDAIMEVERQRHEEHLDRLRIRDEALVPLIDALRAAGYQVSSAFDIVHLADGPLRLYQAAIPILLEHLQRPYPKAVRALIAAALFTPAAEVAWDQIIAQYRSDSDDYVKQKLANAIIKCTNKTRLGEVIDLVRDPKNGPTRVLLLWVLTHSRDPRARETIMDLIDDPDLKIQIALYLKGRKKRMH